MERFKKLITHSSGQSRFFRRFIYGLVIFLPIYFVLHTYAQRRKQAMSPVGYLISLTTLSATVSNREVIQASLKMSGHWLPIMGMTKDSVSMDLFVVPATGKNVEELTALLKAIPRASNVSVVALSKPAKSAELAGVRRLLAGFDLNAGNVSDKQLSLFLSSKLDEQYTYYIDPDRKQNLKGLHDIRIKRLEEHPQYSPAWRKKSVVKQQDTTQNLDTIEVRDVMVQTIERVKPPPPPPPPPANLGQMSNAQILRWIQKNDSRLLTDKDVQINRTAEEVMIAIKVKEGTETLCYTIRK